jgi:Spy/CpxP family protein refolding chaperone
VKILKVILATLIIFGTGVVTGGLMIANVYQRVPTPNAAPLAQRPAVYPPVPFHEMQRVEFVHRLDKQLELSREQREGVAAIMKESNQRTKAMWEPLTPTMREEVKMVREKIRSVLTPEQRKKFDKDTAMKNRPRKENKMEGESAAPTGESRPAKGKKPFQPNRTNIPAGPAQTIERVD